MILWEWDSGNSDDINTLQKESKSSLMRYYFGIFIWIIKNEWNSLFVFYAAALLQTYRLSREKQLIWLQRKPNLEIMTNSYCWYKFIHVTMKVVNNFLSLNCMSITSWYNSVSYIGLHIWTVATSGGIKYYQPQRLHSVDGSHSGGGGDS